MVFGGVVAVGVVVILVAAVLLLEVLGEDVPVLSLEVFLLLSLLPAQSGPERVLAASSENFLSTSVPVIVKALSERHGVAIVKNISTLTDETKITEFLEKVPLGLWLNIWREDERLGFLVDLYYYY